MSALPQTSSPQHLSPGPSSQWIDLPTAAARSGRTVGHLARECRGKYAAQNLAKLEAPASECKKGGAPIWFIHETAHPSFARVKSRQQRDENFDRRLLTQRQRDRLKVKEYVVGQWTIVRAAAIAAGKNLRRDVLPVFVERMALEKIQVSPASVYNWHGALTRDGVAGLVEEGWLRKTARAGGGDNPFTPFYEDMQRWYLAPQRRSIQLSYDRAKDEAVLCGWPIPSYKSAQRFLNAIPRDIVAYHRGGEQARKAASSCIKCDYSTLNSNDGWCGDHHQFDVKILHEGEHVRPWGTFWIDMRSRFFVGWRIFAHSPNQATILDALHDGGESHGYPLEVLIDNGKDFDAQALQGVTKRQRLSRKPRREKGIMDLGVFGKLGIKVGHAKPYHPQRKLIERAFRTVCDRFSKLWDTYCGNCPQNRPHNHQAQLDAGKAPTLAEFIDSFRDWLDADYHARAHLGDAMDGKSPAEVFAANLKEKRIIPPGKWELARMKPTREMTVTANGVQHDHLWYGKGDPALMMLRGQKVRGEIGTDSIDQLHIYSPEGGFLCIACLNDKIPVLGAKKKILDAVLSDQRREAKVTREYMKVQPRMHETLPDRMVRKAAEQRRAQKQQEQFNPGPKPPSKIIQTPLDDQSKEVQKAIVRQRMQLRPASGQEGMSLLAAADDLPSPTRRPQSDFSLLSLAGDNQP